MVKINDRRMVALDRPYINLDFHIKCYNSISNMERFLKKTYQTWRKPWFK